MRPIPPTAPTSGDTGACSQDLRGFLAAIPGLKLKPAEPLARHTTLRIGGPAELLVEVASEEALVALLQAARAVAAPVVVLGLGSNVLIPDEGLSGLVLRLGGDLKRVTFQGDEVESGAALPLALLARRTASQGLVGLEALSGFPSTVGGAVYMNAGCYGTEIRDTLLWARVVDPDGTRRRLATDDLAPAYRRTNLHGSGAIVTAARFKLRPGEATAALARIEELNKKRWASLPSGEPNAGSIFRNPPSGDPAGRLLEACGLKGEVSGGARISPKHANVIVNTGGARAEDVFSLMLEGRRRVAERFGLTLEPEIVLAGSLLRRWQGTQ